MKSKVLLACLCGSILVWSGTTVRAQDADGDDSQPSTEKMPPKDTGPYAMITARNIFHLNPPPPPPPPPTNDTAASTAGGLKLTGFFKSAGSAVRALFVNVPSNPTNTVYYNLIEGERDGALELIKINESDESAEVIHAGTRLTVLLKDSKPVSTGAPGVPGAPGMPGAPGQPPRPGNPAPPVVASVPAPAAVPAANRSTIVGGNSSRGSSGVVTGNGLAMMGGAAPIGGNTVAATPNNPNTARNIRATTGFQPQNHEEATAAFTLDSVAHEQEIKAGKYPPPPPIPGYNYNR